MSNQNPKIKKVIDALSEGSESVDKNPSEENYLEQESKIERAGKNSNWAVYVFTGVIVVLFIYGITSGGMYSLDVLGGRQVAQTEPPYTNAPLIDFTTTPIPQIRPTTIQTSKQISSSVCDNFDNSTLTSGWDWIDPNSDSIYNLTDNPGFLRITVSGSNHDLYQNLNAPRMLQEVKGDFTVVTKVTIYPLENYQAAGLLYWQDENNYVRLERTLVQGIDLLYKIQGTYSAIEIPFSISPVFLKFEFSNQNLSSFYSADGNKWNFVETLQLSPSNNDQVGIVVVNEWQENTISADFDYFMFSQCQ